MASRSVKKVLRKIYMQDKNFKPNDNPAAWNKCVAYIKAKDKRMAFNARFRPLFAELKKQLRTDGYHETEVASLAKAKAKEILKIEDLAKVATA